jgi:hypothetical protein
MDEHTPAQKLKRILWKRTDVYTNVVHVSRSGMSREIKLYAVKDNSIVDITYYVGEILGERRGKNYWLVISGCWMDMCFYVVYRLSQHLFPKKDAYYLNKKDL